MYRDNVPTLFTSEQLDQSVRGAIQAAIAEVEKLSPDEMLTISETDFVDTTVQKHQVDPVKLLKDKIYQHEPREVELQVVPHSGAFGACMTHAFLFSVVIPFTGHPHILRLTPPTFNHNPPRGRVENSEITLEYCRSSIDGEELAAAYSQDLKKIEQWLEWGESTIHSYNASVPELIRKAFEERKKKILEIRGLAEALNLPIKRRDMPATYAIPVVRKRPSISTPVYPPVPFKPEPALTENDYEFILKIIRDVSLVMERSPHTFAKLSEEEIRDHMIMHLNGHFQGEATAETFNNEGKTDVLIRHAGQNVFIAECAMWKGPEYFRQKIDQLLGYKCWRDSKTAILLFSRNKEFSGVLMQIPEVAEAHMNFKKRLEDRHEYEFRYLFHHRDDHNREFFLTVIPFHVPT